jgi:1,4-dihydroxy-2-naphthoate octaprenyltransferase
VNYIKRFFGYVEIKTKIASLLPFILALSYAYYIFHNINVLNSLLFFISMLLFDMTTTAINNYIDSNVSGKPLEIHKFTAKIIIILMLFFAVIIGLILCYFTGIVVLVCGTLCFFVGVFYTFGPAPISRMPLGEAFSGVFMGFFIPFLVFFINAPTNYLVFYTFNNNIVQISFNIINILKLVILTIPAICGIANIMLANNICDVEADVKINRFTLPFYIGNRNALYLFSSLYYISYISVVVIAFLNILPLYVLFLIFTLIPIQKNITTFIKKQSKAETFSLSGLNLIILIVPLILIIFISGFIK